MTILLAHNKNQHMLRRTHRYWFIIRINTYMASLCCFSKKTDNYDLGDRGLLVPAFYEPASMSDYLCRVLFVDP